MYAVLGADPRAVDPETLDTVAVLATSGGGEVVYKAPLSRRSTAIG